LSDKPVEIFDNIFRVGACQQVNELYTNSYLMVDGDEGILFGPGSVIDFEETFANITKIIPIEKLKYAVLHSQDPSICASLPLFEQNGFSGKIVTHMRTAYFVKHYGITSFFIYTNLAANRLILESGRVIYFLNTPYLKSAGSFIAYDNVSRILFSGDLFGAFQKQWKLYAGEDYPEEMKKYHGEYMPGSNFLRYALESAGKKDISMIAPQYGSVINKDIKNNISALMNIQCGTFYNDIKIDSAGNSSITGLCNDLLKIYYQLFSKNEVLDIFRDSSINIDEETGLIRGSTHKGTELWNYFFDLIVSRKSFNWLTLVEDDLRRITSEYKVDYPKIYNSSFLDLKLKYARIEKERTSLVETLNALEKEYKVTDNKLLKDPLAQVYKEDMFVENLTSDIAAYRNLDINFAFFIIEIDNLILLNTKYGREAGDELLANTAYLLKNFKKASKDYAHHLIFRMNGPRFTYYCNDVTRDEIVSIAEAVRTEFRESKLFITNITVSIGVVHSSDFSKNDRIDDLDLVANIIEIANSRLRLAKHKGSDSVCSDSVTNAGLENEDYIMVIDPDISLRYMLETHLMSAGFRVVTCAMGDEALEKIDMAKPQVIISGMMLPKIDGFSLRNKLLEESALKDIPFILTSSVKDEKSIIRAQSLGIYHYFKKPYSIVELIGLVKNLSKAES